MKIDFSKPMLQVALDVVDLEEALRIAEEVYSVGVDIIEIGTPLIKNVGLKSVKVFKKKFPDALILTDMKTVDASALEVRMAANAGANITTIMGFIDDTSILMAVKEARKSNILLQADLMYVKDLIKRAKELVNLGIDIIGLHVGIDVQKAKHTSIADIKDLVKLIAGSIEKPISVAGGLNKYTIRYMVEAGANIIVVGSAIVKAKDPGKEAREILNIIRSK